MPVLEGTGPFGPLLPDHPSEFVVGIILFLIILVVARVMIVPRFEKMYTERADSIRGGIDRADQAQAEAQATLAAYKAQLAKVNDEAAAIRSQAKDAGAAILADSKAQAEHEAQRIVTQARQQVEAERAQVIDAVRRDVGGIATTLAGKIIQDQLVDDARAKQTVDDFLASLETESAKEPA